MMRYSLFLICISVSYIFATSSMLGTKKQGYFDDDNILDTLDCSNNGTIDEFQCKLLYGNNKSKIITIKNSRACGNRYISNYKKGEISITCPVRLAWNETYDYKYNKIKDNWYLYKYTYDTVALGPDSETEFFETNKFSKEFTILDEISDVKNGIILPNVNSSMETIIQKLSQ